MFINLNVKHVHELAKNDVLLWEGHHHVIDTVTPNGPQMTELVTLPVNPASGSLKVTLRSDMLIMTKTWN